METCRHMDEGQGKGDFSQTLRSTAVHLDEEFLLGLDRTMLKVDACKDIHTGAVKPWISYKSLWFLQQQF